MDFLPSEPPGKRVTAEKDGRRCGGFQALTPGFLCLLPGAQPPWCEEAQTVCGKAQVGRDSVLSAGPDLPLTADTTRQPGERGI